MWYFIHIPKCAGSFVKKQLGIIVTHTHHNLKLKEVGMKRMGELNLSDGSDLQEFGKRLLQEESRVSSFINEGHWGHQKIRGTGMQMTSEGPTMVKGWSGGGLHQPFAALYVDKINRKNGEGSYGLTGEDLEPITPEKSFSIVRNPFSWLASYYKHSDIEGQLGWEWVNQIHGFKSFKEFVVGYCTRESKDWHEPCLQRFMGFQLFDKNDNVIPKYIIYKERLYEGVGEYLGHKMTAQKDRKAYPDYNYRKMYDNEMIDLVNEKMKHELKLFNYDFEGPKKDNVGFVNLKHKYDIIKDKHVVLS